MVILKYVFEYGWAVIFGIAALIVFWDMFIAPVIKAIREKDYMELKLNLFVYVIVFAIISMTYFVYIKSS